MWAERVIAMLRHIGADRAAGDAGMCMLLPDGHVFLEVAVHVVDFLNGGRAEGLALCERELKAAFSVAPIETGAFAFTGLSMSFVAGSTARSAHVWVHQLAYADSIDDILLSAERKNTMSAAVTVHELTLYRRATGALLWAACQTLPHLACGAAFLARHSRYALISDLARENKIIAAARCSRAGAGACLYLFTDSVKVSLRSTAAQKGFSLLLGNAGRVVGTRGTAVAAADGVLADLVA